HTGEMIVNAAASEDVLSVFENLYAARFPIEEMRVVDLPELDLPPTGDGNNTTSFVCRSAVGSTNWSRHAYGLAIDLNPFLNPYEKGDLVLPELASAYLDRGWVRPGMIYLGDVVTGSFGAIGWEWGGEWTTLTDLHHFSDNGR
ncbi:MAG: M15 family metallopeptidase, partial [Acidimicrobiia bacterium]|nr:M15 family metallopeptidase [Acidimicrobiia bacterium]